MEAEAVETVAAEPEAATLEAPETTGVADTGAEAPESAPAAEPAAPEADASGKAGTEQDNRLLPQEVRQHLAELKATNPALAGKIRDAFGQAAAIRREFPGGLAEARAIKQLATEIGGPEGVKDLQDRMAEADELDRLWKAKDPRAVDNMAEDYPEQFAALMPHALSQWNKHDPEGFNRNACGVVAATLQQPNEEGFSAMTQMWMAEQSLAMGNTEQAAAILKNLQEWGRGFSRAATAPAKQPDTAPNADRERAEQLQRQLQEKERESFDGSVGQAVESFADQKIESAVAPYIKGRTLPDGQRETLRAKVVQNLMSRLQADQQFVAARSRYTEARDRDGLVQMSKAKIEALLPTAAKEAHRWLFGGAPASKPAAVKTAASPGGAAPATNGQKPWIKVAKMPGIGEVDGDRTPFEMKMKSSAVLKDGRRVYWGQQPYQGK
jgi:hypothetical protein